MLELAVKTLLAYLLGSVPGSLAVGQLRGVDIRTQGSGNAGGTNALRTQGLGFALVVIFIDVGKGWLAAGVLPLLALPGIGISQAVDRDWLAAGCGAAAVVGHVYPVWYEFRGGKGAATVIGALLALAPLALVPMLIVWLASVMLTGYVGLGTMLGAATMPAWFWWWAPQRPALLLFGIAMAAFVVYAHRSNIARMRSGSESRARRLWLLRPR